jgi:hypothetical protein
MNPADYQYTYGQQMTGEVSQLYTMVMDLGIPACVIIASFWFIKYTTDQARREREAFWAKDAENDEKLMAIVEKSSDAILSIKLALEQNTQAIRELMVKK